MVRFLSINSDRTTNPMTIATIIPMTAGTKYMSTPDFGARVGPLVGADASETLIAVSAEELP